MKVIDLLNKIAKGEEVPNKIKFENYIYNWRNMQKDYFCKQINYSLESIIGDYIFNNLNLKVEIIEENKDIEKIGNLKYCENEVESILHRKIDELVEEVNKLKGKHE